MKRQAKKILFCGITSLIVYNLTDLRFRAYDKWPDLLVDPDNVIINELKSVLQIN